MSLIVKPINAMFLEDSGIGDSDPYAVVMVGQEKKKGNYHNGAGKNPQWADTFVFTSKDQLMRVEVWDYDTISSDDLMGEGTMNLAQCYQNPNRTQNQYVDLRKNGKPVGRILLSVQYQGPPIGGGFNQGGWGNQGNQGNQGGWGNQGNQGGWGNQGNQGGGWGNQGNQGNQGGWGNQGNQGGGWGNQGNQGGMGSQPNQGGGWGNQGNQGGWGNQGNQGGWGNQGGNNNGW